MFSSLLLSKPWSEGRRRGAEIRGRRGRKRSREQGRRRRIGRRSTDYRRMR